MTRRKKLWVFLVAAWYGFGQITFDAAPTGWENDESRHGQLLLGDDMVSMVWLTDGTIILPDGERGTRCKLLDHTFALEVSYVRPSGSKKWRKKTGKAETRGDVDMAKLRQALKLYSRTRRPLTLPELGLIARGIENQSPAGVA